MASFARGSELNAPTKSGSTPSQEHPLRTCATSTLTSLHVPGARNKLTQPRAQFPTPSTPLVGSLHPERRRIKRVEIHERQCIIRVRTNSGHHRQTGAVILKY